MVTSLLLPLFSWKWLKPSAKEGKYTYCFFNFNSLLKMFFQQFQRCVSELSTWYSISSVISPPFQLEMQTKAENSVICRQYTLINLSGMIIIFRRLCSRSTRQCPLIFHHKDQTIYSSNSLHDQNNFFIYVNLSILKAINLNCLFKDKYF